jgi:hypothetical protein
VHGVEGEGEPGQGRPEAVVEVAADAATLLLPQVDQAAPSGLQLLREADGMGGPSHSPACSSSSSSPTSARDRWQPKAARER